MARINSTKTILSIGSPLYGLSHTPPTFLLQQETLRQKATKCQPQTDNLSIATAIIQKLERPAGKSTSEQY